MKLTWSAAGLSTLIVGAACLMSGCGGSSNNGTTNAQVKSYDAIPNGGTAAVTVSGGLNATVTAFNGSAYVFATPGLQNASFTLTGPPTFTSPNYATSINSSAYYTAILVGRDDVASNDARAPQLVLAGDDQTSPSSADSRIRVVNAAPDAGNVDVLVNGVNTAPNTAYPSFTSYSELAAGSATITVRQTGSATIIVPSTVFSTTAGHRYTIYVTEPTVSTPAYAFQVVQDS